MRDLQPSQLFRTALISSTVPLLLALTGMVEAFSKRGLIGEAVSVGHVLLFLSILIAAYLFERRQKSPSPLNATISGIVIGGVSGIVLVVLVFLTKALIPKPWDLRSIFPNASPALIEVLTFSRGERTGALLLFLFSVVSGLIGTLFPLIPLLIRGPLTTGFLVTLIVGLLQDIISTLPIFRGKIIKFFFARSGFKPVGALLIFIVTIVLAALWHQYGRRLREEHRQLQQRRPMTVQIAVWTFVLLFLLVLPRIVGSYMSEVLDTVGLYILMGLGLNIVVGFAGMLDLGYVAFFAIGAYTMAVLTSTELGFFNLTFWEALPLSILASIAAGVILGVPVLKMRGDYLAIVTMGFGEIIRILVLSDFLKPILGGAQGLTRIARPVIEGPIIGRIVIKDPPHFYYLILIGCLIALFISIRLKASRLGRAWMAIREDEDVAEAMGINLVTTKLLAFATGAALSGLSGAIFASKINSMAPHSFNLLISIYVLSLIIVGGMGSLPGVVVGAFALMGLPELLREFAEYRMLVYGAAMVVMMLYKPEGLWPEATHVRALRQEESREPVPEPSPKKAPAATVASE